MPEAEGKAMDCLSETAFFDEFYAFALAHTDVREQELFDICNAWLSAPAHLRHGLVGWQLALVLQLFHTAPPVRRLITEHSDKLAFVKSRVPALVASMRDPPADAAALLGEIAERCDPAKWLHRSGIWTWFLLEHGVLVECAQDGLTSAEKRDMLGAAHNVLSLGKDVLDQVLPLIEPEDRLHFIQKHFRLVFVMWKKEARRLVATHFRGSAVEGAALNLLMTAVRCPEFDPE